MFLCKSLTKFCGSPGNILDSVSSSSTINIINACSSPSVNPFQQQKRNINVTVLGSAGGVGAPLCMLLKQSPLITKIKCFDIKPHTLGIAMDCSHIEGRATMKAYKDPNHLSNALCGTEIVVMCACAHGELKKPGSRNQFFQKNSVLAKKLAEQIAITAPNAIVLVVTNPINALVPLIAEVFKERKMFNPRKLIGMTILDTIRANRFFAATTRCNPLNVNVPVIGGQSEHTIVPVFSQAKPHMKLHHDQWLKLVNKVKCANNALIRAKNIDTSAGNYTHGMAYAAARFITSLSLARRGKKNVVETCYVRSDICKNIKFLSTPCVLGRRGIEKVLGIPKLNKCEEEWLNEGLKSLKKDIKMGIDFVKKDHHGKKPHDKKHHDKKPHGKKPHGKKHHGKKPHGKKHHNDKKHHGKKHDPCKKDQHKKKDHKDKKCK